MIIIDCEGNPVQELSALYINDATCKIEDVFHHHVHYPFIIDYDVYARRHIHGLDISLLRQPHLPSLGEVLDLFNAWLQKYPSDKLYGHAPVKEKDLISLFIYDACLKPWAERVHCRSHQMALNMKLNCKPVRGVTCSVHSQFIEWRVKNELSPSATDIAKKDFGHHCSLYDCMEVFLFLLFKE